jgi:ferritin-like metal-binding protein YciE
MGETNMEDMLVSYMRDAHAMEKNVHKMLQSLVSTTDEPEIKAAMEHHLEETQRHEELLRARLEQKGADVTAVKDIPAMLGAMAKSIGDMIRSDKPGKNARDAYVTESLEIAAYELLERLADRCGDSATAAIARSNKAEELAMRSKIEQNWDKVLNLTLTEKLTA